MGKTVKDRTLEFIDYLGIKMKTFEEKCSLSTGYITSMRKGFGSDKLNNVLKAYPQLNREWLLYGEGEMLKSERPQIDEGAEGIPLLPVKAQGGSLNEFVASPMLHECERIVCPIGGVDFAMTISGESMYPEYPNGSQIFVKKVNEKAFVEWGKCYVLDTCNGAVIKILVPGADETRVKCLSVNKDERYAPFEVAWKDVFGVYRVVLCMQVK